MASAAVTAQVPLLGPAGLEEPSANTRGGVEADAASERNR